MAAPCLVREARAGDVPAIAAIESRAFSDPWPSESFATFLGAYTLVAERDERVVGFLVARRAADEVEVLDLAVEQEERRQGVARNLLNELVRRVTASAVRVLFLEVRSSNQAARALYEGLGFRLVGRRARYYANPVEDALILACGIGNSSGPA